MKTSRTMVLAAMAITTFALAAQDGTLLRRKLDENTTDVYKITTSVKQTVNSPATGEQEMNIETTAHYQLKVGKVDGTTGTAEIEATTTVDEIKADGPAGAMLGGQKPAPIVQKGKIDVRNRLTMQAAKSADAMAMMMGGGVSSSNSSTFVELPEKPVKIGDTWEVIVPKSPFTGKVDQKLTAKLVGEKQVDGKDVWVVSLSGTVTTDVDTSTIPKDPNADASNPMANMKMLIKGKLDMTGEGIVDKATGKTLSMTTTGKMKNAVELVDMGMNIDTAGTVESKVVLQK